MTDSERRVPTILLCGGRGTRISEVNPQLPKPLLPIGNRPVVWHIMKIYAAHGFTDFVLALGWLGDQIRRFVLDYEAMICDFTVELGRREHIEFHNRHPEEGWRISCIDTGIDALTGTRVRRAADAAGIREGTLMVTYGDGVADVDLTELVAFHRSHGRLATVTAVRPPGRFGELVFDGDRVTAFEEKPQTSSGAINGGFLVLEREAIDRFIPTDADVMLEREPMTGLASAGELMAFRHDGFFQPMDTPRERDLLEGLWAEGKAPWRVWDE